MGQNRISSWLVDNIYQNLNAFMDNGEIVEDVDLEFDLYFYLNFDDDRYIIQRDDGRYVIQGDDGEFYEIIL